jgi:hypothetical protein
MTRNQTREKEKQKDQDKVKDKLTPQKSNKESMMLPTPDSKTSHGYQNGNGKLTRN